jgi:integrase
MLRPDDFARLRADALTGRNATTATNVIIRQRSVFKWGHSTARLLAAPADYGGAFALPSARLRRRALRANGPKDLTAPEIRKLLDAARRSAGLKNLHAMILLGINAGLGNTDCAELRVVHLDLKAGVLDFPRPKTDAPRRAVLWPTTVKALRGVLEHRKGMEGVPQDLADRVFLTRQRRPYVSISPTSQPVDSVGMEFRRLAAAVGVHRRGIGFYSLRHTFQTVADETRDFPAIDLVMGHVPDADQMSARYRERISDERLTAVATRVYTWLFGLGRRRTRNRRTP